MYYLTDDDFAEAKKNGISWRNLYNRFYHLGWNVERAINEPVNKGKWPNLKKFELKNGISFAGFYHRLQSGMTPEEAATLPVLKNGQKFKQKPLKITADDLKVAEKNGIKPGTVKARVYQYKWTVQLAITTPTGSIRPNRKSC